MPQVAFVVFPGLDAGAVPDEEILQGSDEFLLIIRAIRHEIRLTLFQ
jgi:hypothetical protein